MAENMFLQKLQAGLLGKPNNYGGALSDDDLKSARQQAMMAMGAQLLQAGGPSSQPIGLGQAIGSSLMTGQQVQQGANESALKSLLLKSQIEKASRATTSKPMVVGAGGAVVDPTGKVLFQNPASGPQGTASIQDFEYFRDLTPEQQKQFLSLQRSPVVPQLAIVNGVPTLVDKIDKTTTPLSTLSAEADAARTVKEAEARGAAFGKAGGELAAGILKKGTDAKSAQDMLEGADALIDIATGSTAGNLRDKTLAVFGYAPEPAQAIAELQVLQAQLMLQQPRMEGPQGVLDVQLYQQMAGQIGDPNVPAANKKAALRTIRRLQDKYAERAGIGKQADEVVNWDDL